MFGVSFLFIVLTIWIPLFIMDTLNFNINYKKKLLSMIILNGNKA